jgi:hypothetical protein
MNRRGFLGAIAAAFVAPKAALEAPKRHLFVAPADEAAAMRLMEESPYMRPFEHQEFGLSFEVTSVAMEDDESNWRDEFVYHAEDQWRNR